MSNNARQVVRARMQVSTTSTGPDLRDLSSLLSPAGINAVFGRVVLTEVSGPLSVQVVVQTYDGDPEVMNTAVAPTSGLNYAARTAVGKTQIRFDPSAVGNGDITNKGGFRLGLNYWSGTAGTLARGEVIVELWVNG